MSNPIRRTLHPETRILDAKKGLVEYIASDETLDSYREVIRADGWRFTRFSKNAPFVDSHDYGTVEKLLGQVVSFGVEHRRLVETVQWAIDVPENQLAQLGWAMTEAGYLKAVSVGFLPVRTASRWDSNPAEFNAQVKELALDSKTVNAIFIEQEQIELSACIIGANPAALAKSYKAGVLTDAALEFISTEYVKRVTASAAISPVRATSEAPARARERFLERVQTITKQL